MEQQRKDSLEELIDLPEDLRTQIQEIHEEFISALGNLEDMIADM